MMIAVLGRRCWTRLCSRRGRASVLGAVFVLGLLFWARLIVVADMPRTAIAEPDGVPPAGGRFSPAEGLPLSMPGLHRGTTTRPVEAEIPAASPNPGQDAQNDAIRLPN